MRINESAARLLRSVGAFTAAVAAGCAGLGPLPENRPAPEDEVPQVYGTTAKRSPTNSTSSFVVDEMEKAVYSRIEDLLVRVPGLRVLPSPSGGIALQIRGQGAVTGEPLLVIDGLPIHTAPGSALATLRPHDVVRIDVLKNASAAIYGIRGGNGVVVITTRRGS